MTTPTPFYDADGITIYHGDNREILPTLGKFDLLLTDPPYGIGQDKGMGGGGGGFYPERYLGVYEGEWDSQAPTEHMLKTCIGAASLHIVWGGNYFASLLSRGRKWLVWDKEQTMPSYSDAELAWTSLPGASTKMFRYCGAGLMAKEKQRQHPTQKPLSLMTWCLSHAPKAQSVLDPFMGSGTTLVAAKLKGLRATGIEISEEYCEIAVRRLRQGVLIPA